MKYKIMEIHEKDNYYWNKDWVIGKVLDGEIMNTWDDGYSSAYGRINDVGYTFHRIKLEPADNLGLEMIFAKQKELQEKIGVAPANLVGEERTQFIRMMFIGLVTEAAEAIECIPWKPWKRSAVYDEDGLKEELVDVFHFFVNLCLVAGMSPEELVERYINKHKINMGRQKNGY